MKKQIRELRNSLALAVLVLAMSVCAFAQQAVTADNTTASDQAGVPAVVAYAVKAPETATTTTSAPAPPAGGSSITFKGFYVGAHVGHGAGTADTNFNPLPTAATFINLAPQTLHPDPGGVVGGGQVGYNFQIRHFVIGVEWDISGSNMHGTKTVTPITQNNGTPFPGAGFVSAHQDTSWIGSIRPRLGMTIGSRLLFFGTGGLAFGGVSSSAQTDFRPIGTEQYPAAVSETKTGWTAGGGFEVALDHRWSFGFQYLHYDLGSQSATANPVPPLPPFQVAYVWETTANIANGTVNFRW